MSTVSRPSRKLTAPSRQESPQAAIGRLLKNMHQSVRQAVDESLRRQRVDLSFAHFVALYTLASEPGVTGAELARRGFVTSQTMNTILHRLEKERAIERRPNPKNQRADSWYITKTGQTNMERAQVVVEGVWSGMFDTLRDQEVRQLQSLLERCLARLEQQVSELKVAKSARAAQAKKRSTRPTRRS